VYLSRQEPPPEVESGPPPPVRPASAGRAERRVPRAHEPVHRHLLDLPPGLLVGALGLFGAYYAAADGVLMAMASAILPADLRSRGLALLTTTIAIGRPLASVAFGALWSWRGPTSALVCFLVALVAALAVALVVLRRPPAGATAQAWG